jgi:hypothetical protein
VKPKADAYLLSDHADWNGLLQAIKEAQAEKVVIKLSAVIYDSEICEDVFL